MRRCPDLNYAIDDATYPSYLASRRSRSDIVGSTPSSTSCLELCIDKSFDGLQRIKALFMTAKFAIKKKGSLIDWQQTEQNACILSRYIKYGNRKQ